MQSLTIIGRTYFDKVYGNSYHTVRVVVDGQNLGTTKRSYGAGQGMLLRSAILHLKDLGHELPPNITDSSYWGQWRDAGITLVVDECNVARIKDLHHYDA